MSINRSILTGAIWVVAARWGIRGIGLISTLILVRLLTPADFGVVAMAMIVVGMVEVFGETGLVLYVIRHPDPKDDHFNTVWTLRLIVGLVLAAVLFLGAEQGAIFFNEPAIEPAIQLLALRPLMLGLENPGILWFRKNMEFNRDFEFLVLNKIVAFVVTIALAYWLRNYWALVFGILTGGLAALLQSYRMHPYRPWFCLKYTRDAWGFSFWILVQNLFVYFEHRLDELIIGRLKSTESLGFYAVASDVAASPVREIVVPASRAMFPGFAKLAGDPEALANSFARIQAAIAIIAFSVSTGIALVAYDLTYFLLGEKWLEIVPLLQILTLSAGVFSISQPMFTLMSSLGRVRLSACLTMMRIALLAAIIVPIAMDGDLADIAFGRLIATIIATFLSFAVFIAIDPKLLWATIIALLRPAIATLGMVACVLLLQEQLADMQLLRFIASIGVGALSFAIGLLLIWLICGRPNTIEADVLHYVKGRFGLR